MSVIEAAKGYQTARVPVAPMVTLSHAARISGIKPLEYILNAEKYAEAQIYTKKFYGYDWVWAHQFFGGITKKEKDGIKKSEYIILPLEIGVQYKIPYDGAPQLLKTAIPAKEELKNLKIPDANAEERIKPIKLMLEKEDFVCGNMRCPFTLASTFLYNLESFLLALKTDEDFAFELLDFALEYCIEYARAQIKAGVHAIFIEDPSASNSVISAQDYRKFALPYEKKLVREIKKVPVIFHICGDVNPILGDMIATGVDCISVDEVMPIAEVHKRIPVWGNVAPSLLTNGTEKEVYEISKKIVELKTRVILSSGCVVPANAKEENVRAMVKAAYE